MDGKYFNIAIDGPAGAGKSTVARMIARRLGFIYVDTGAMFRAIALYVLRSGIDIQDETLIEQACRSADISIRYQDGIQQVVLNGENVTDLIRTEQVGKISSALSVYGCIRVKLLELQRNLAAQADVVMDGRDIGTCVLPHADLKIYLTAGIAVRALRRYRELCKKGRECNLEEIEQDIIERDRRDMEREIAPLKQAEDAVLIDGSDCSIDQVIELILNQVQLNGLKGNI